MHHSGTTGPRTSKQAVDLQFARAARTHALWCGHACIYSSSRSGLVRPRSERGVQIVIMFHQKGVPVKRIANNKKHTGCQAYARTRARKTSRPILCFLVRFVGFEFSGKKVFFPPDPQYDRPGHVTASNIVATAFQVGR